MLLEEIGDQGLVTVRTYTYPGAVGCVVVGVWEIKDVVVAGLREAKVCTKKRVEQNITLEKATALLAQRQIAMMPDWSYSA